MNVEIIKKLFAPGSIAVYGKRGSCWRVVKFTDGGKEKEGQLYVESMNKTRKNKFDSPLSNFRPYPIQLGAKVYSTANRVIVGNVSGFNWSAETETVLVSIKGNVASFVIPEIPAPDLLGISGEYTINPNF